MNWSTAASKKYPICTLSQAARDASILTCACNSTAGANSTCKTGVNTLKNLAPKVIYMVVQKYWCCKFDCQCVCLSHYNGIFLYLCVKGMPCKRSASGTPCGVTDVAAGVVYTVQ